MPPKKIKEDRELADAQIASAEDKPKDEAAPKAPVHKRDDGYYVEVAGKEFKLADELGMMAALKFNAMTESDDDLDLDTLYLLLYSLLADENEFARFERHAIIKRAGSDELVGVITGALESFGGRPTKEPSGS
jgi:hypothetical protein